jgi:hypothetical protein
VLYICFFRAGKRVSICMFVCSSLHVRLRVLMSSCVCVLVWVLLCPIEYVQFMPVFMYLCVFSLYRCLCLCIFVWDILILCVCICA